MNKKTPNLRLLDKTEEKDHTRKPVIRDPLPEKDLITLCEFVTWRATGKARSAAVLRRFMRRHQGQRQATELRASFERAAATVVSLCRKGDLSPNGSVDGNPHEPFSEGYFLSDVYADPMSDSIGLNLLAWARASPYPDENPEEPRELSIYRSVRFLRSDLLSTFEPAADDIDQRAAKASTDAAMLVETLPPALPSKGFSSRKVTEWYKSRVADWKAGDPIPTLDDDVAAAKNKFNDKVTQRFVRDLRDNFAPPAWNVHKRGPKPNPPKN